MELTVLGCSGSYGDPRGGACSGYLVRSGDTALWLDCGNGTFAHLQQHIAPEDLTAVVITHEHPDHCVDVYGLHVLMKWGLKREGFPVFAPEGLDQHLGALVGGDWGGALAWTSIGDNDHMQIGSLGLRFSRTDHPPPTYAVEIHGDNRRLVYTADTGPAWSVDAFAPGADLVLSEATYLDGEKPAEIHLSAKEAGTAAREAGARRLMLTHLWPRIDPRRAVDEGSDAYGDAVTLAAPHLVTRIERDMPRRDGREADELRTVAFTRDYTEMAAGSVLVEFGRTRVLCTASVEERVPPWMRGTGRGWVTAEYSMLPGSSSDRIEREAQKGRPSGRTQEIQRLIGRSLRAVTDLTTMGEVQITVDCDVLQADGGTRTASICGGYLALHDACSRLVGRGVLRAHPLGDQCGAVSVGVVDAIAYLDLDYSEDSRAEVDMNVVMTSSGRFIEVQGTAEGMPFSRSELDDLLGLAEGGITELFALQRELLSEPPPPRAT